MAKKPGKKAKKTEGTHVQTKTIEKTFAIKLTKDRKAELLDRRVVLENQIEELQKEAKKKADEFKNLIHPLETELDNISEVARAGEEDCMVKCECQMDFLNGEVRYVHDGKILEKRSMTTDEYQLEIHVSDRARNRGMKDMPKVDEKKADAQGEDIAQAIREETNKKTKNSAVDGPTAH